MSFIFSSFLSMRSPVSYNSGFWFCHALFNFYSAVESHAQNLMMEFPDTVNRLKFSKITDRKEFYFSYVLYLQIISHFTYLVSWLPIEHMHIPCCSISLLPTISLNCNTFCPLFCSCASLHDILETYDSRNLEVS